MSLKDNETRHVLWLAEEPLNPTFPLSKLFWAELNLPDEPGDADDRLDHVQLDKPTSP